MAKKDIIEKFGYELYKREIRLRENIDVDLQPYDVTLPEPPPYEDFINYGLPKEEQFFVREEKPDWLEKLNMMPRAQAIELAATTREFGEWIEDQWRKRREGVFMYIYGKPLWIPGKYWFYLNYVPLARDYPDFRYPDLEQAYWLDLCVEKNPRVVGGIIITSRRDGKSAWAWGGVALEAATRVPKYVGAGIAQSLETAEKAFQEHMVPAWRTLPFFFSPVFDHKTSPRKEFNFKKPSRGGSKLDTSDLIIGSLEDKDLQSKFMVGPTKEGAFDGKRLGGASYEDVCVGFIIDEGAKLEEIDVYQAAMVHAECLRIKDERVGKMLILTTVEQMTPKGLKNFKKLCDESSRVPERKKIDQEGRTKTGLIIFFKPGWETICYDQWGFPVIDTPRPDQAQYLKERWLRMGDDKYVEMGGHLLGGRKMLEKEFEAIEDFGDKQAHISRYPPSLAAAFNSVNKGCPFISAPIIMASLMRFRYGDPFTEGFDLYWDTSTLIPKVKVRWNEKGKFRGSRPLIEFIIEHRANNVRINDQGMLIPCNESLYMISSDPYKYGETEGILKSMGSITAFMNFDDGIDGNNKPMSEWETEDWGIHYLNRPKDPIEFVEDVKMLCHWLGSKVIPENNIDYVRMLFNNWGYSKFLKYKPNFKEKNGVVIVQQASQAGIQTNGGSMREAVINSVDSHLSQHGLRCKHKSILEDCRDLDPIDWSPYDSFVTAGYSCYFAKMAIKPKKQEVKIPDTYKGFTGLGAPKSYGRLKQ